MLVRTVSWNGCRELTRAEAALDLRPGSAARSESGGWGRPRAADRRPSIRAVPNARAKAGWMGRSICPCGNHAGWSVGGSTRRGTCQGSRHGSDRRSWRAAFQHQRGLRPKRCQRGRAIHHSPRQRLPSAQPLPKACAVSSHRDRPMTSSASGTSQNSRSRALDSASRACTFAIAASSAAVCSGVTGGGALRAAAIAVRRMCCNTSTSCLACSVRRMATELARGRSTTSSASRAERPLAIHRAPGGRSRRPRQPASAQDDIAPVVRLPHRAISADRQAHRASVAGRAAAPGRC
jgi:hypothetical protein